MNFLALRPYAGPTQTHAGYLCTPYDFQVHVDNVFFEDNFFVFLSFLHRCGVYLKSKSKILTNEVVVEEGGEIEEDVFAM